MIPGRVLILLMFVLTVIDVGIVIFLEIPWHHGVDMAGIPVPVAYAITIVILLFLMSTVEISALLWAVRRVQYRYR